MKIPTTVSLVQNCQLFLTTDCFFGFANGGHPDRPASELVVKPHHPAISMICSPRKSLTATTIVAAAGIPPPPLDLTEENIRLALVDARDELGKLFDSSIGITGQVELVELDGPYVKISLKGRSWHERSMILARIGNYLKKRIPEILEVEIEDEKQLDDSPANF